MDVGLFPLNFTLSQVDLIMGKQELLSPRIEIYRQKNKVKSQLMPEAVEIYYL
jgi:hypothetical protein